MTAIHDSTADQIALYRQAKKLEQKGELWNAALLMTPLQEGRFVPNPWNRELNNDLQLRSIFYAAELWAKIAEGVIPEWQEECLNNAAQCYDFALAFLKIRAAIN